MNWIDYDECPDKDEHRGPQGPNEDISQCPLCLSITWAMRPEGEQIGFHADDCSLPQRHPSYCQPGGNGHPPTETVRGYWGASTEADIAAERARFKNRTKA